MIQGAEHPVCRVEDLAFAYRGGSFRLAVDSLELASGETVACIGPSGCGKTTLVNLMTGILQADRGSVELAGRSLEALDDAGRRALRLREVGMVFQQFELLDYLDALQNILLPYHLSSRLPGAREARDRAREMARDAGVEHVLSRRPSRLSQGERQRVAICRALVTSPSLVVGDEPTGNLDPRTAGRIVDLLFERTQALGASLFMVTHDHGLLPRFDRQVDMQRWVSMGEES